MWAKYVAEAQRKILSVSDMHLPMLSLYTRLMTAYPREDFDITACLGDFAEPTSEQQLTELVAKIADYFDAIVPGNHEFYARNKVFHFLAQENDLFESIPFIGLNYYYNDRPRFEGYRVVGDAALIGLCNYNDADAKLMDRDTTILSFGDSILKAKALIESLQKDIDFFVLLTHYSYRNGIELAEWLVKNTALCSNQFVVLSGHDHAIYPKNPKVDPLYPVVDAGSHFRSVGLTYVAKPGFDWQLRTEVEPFYQPRIQLPWYYENDNCEKKVQNYFLTSPLSGKITDLLREDLHVDIVLKNAGTDRWSFTDDEELDPYNQPEDFAAAMCPFPEGVYVASLTAEQIRTILQADIDLLPHKKELKEIDFQNKPHLHPSGITYTATFDSEQGKYIVKDIEFPSEKQIYRVAVPTGIVSILGLDSIFNFETVIREDAYMDLDLLETILPPKNAKAIREKLLSAGLVDQENKLTPKFAYRYTSREEMINDLKLSYLNPETQEMLWSLYALPVHPPLKVFIKNWLKERRLTPEYATEDYIGRKKII